MRAPLAFQLAAEAFPHAVIFAWIGFLLPFFSPSCNPSDLPSRPARQAFAATLPRSRPASLARPTQAVAPPVLSGVFARLSGLGGQRLLCRQRRATEPRGSGWPTNGFFLTNGSCRLVLLNKRSLAKLSKQRRMDAFSAPFFPKNRCQR
jgi:hypothetical protein